MSERRPEPLTTVLAYECSGAPAEPICVALFNPAATMRQSYPRTSPWIDASGECIDVSHWMPLPEAPK